MYIVKRPSLEWLVFEWSVFEWSVFEWSTIRKQTFKKFGFRMDSEFECSEFEPLLYLIFGRNVFFGLMVLYLLGRLVIFPVIWIRSNGPA